MYGYWILIRGVATALIPLLLSLMYPSCLLLLFLNQIFYFFTLHDTDVRYIPTDFFVLFYV